MQIHILGNGNSGAETANYIYSIAHNDSTDVEYYYEYGPHGACKLNESMTSIHYVDAPSNRTDLYLKLQASDLIISCGWQYKIPDELTRKGICYNIHPSLLPEYRGRSPLERQNCDNADEYGMTLHKMDSGIDTGPIYLQATYKANESDLDNVVQKGIYVARVLLKRFFDDYPNIICVDQNDSDLAEKVRLNIDS